MAEVHLIDGESLESALRRFKRKVLPEDIIKDMLKGLTRGGFVEEVIEALRGIRPQLVFVGGGHSEPGIQIEISEILRLIRTGCPGVPMITIADRTNDYLTQGNMFRQEVHRDLVKPVQGGSFNRP